MKVEIRKITYQETKPFILGIHYARRMPSISYAFGLFIDDELVGCVTYGSPASPYLCKGIAGEENRKNVIELNRLVLLPDLNGKNYASYLVGRSLRMLPPGLFVVSYADTGWSHVGYVYQATNWLFTGTTKPRTDMYSESGHSRHNCGDSKKRQYRTAKHRYVFLTGSKKQRKRMLQSLRYEVYPQYPKGESVHYDTENPQNQITSKIQSVT